MNTNFTVEQIDEMRDESIKEWALAGAGLPELHRFLVRKAEQRLLGNRAALNEEIITLQAALSGRHEENARLSTRVGQLEEALRQAGLGKTAFASRLPAAPAVSEGLATVHAFLLGEGPLDGYHFGERNPAERGMFWWRKHLYKALAFHPGADSPAVDGLRIVLTYEGISVEQIIEAPKRPAHAAMRNIQWAAGKLWQQLGGEPMPASEATSVGEIADVIEWLMGQNYIDWTRQGGDDEDFSSNEAERAFLCSLIRLAAPAAPTPNTEGGVDYIMAAVQCYANNHEASTFQRIRKMVSESVAAARTDAKPVFYLFRLKDAAQNHRIFKDELEACDNPTQWTGMYAGSIPNSQNVGDAALGQAALDVLAERRRQIEQEGWTAERDDAYVDYSLAQAAAAYALAATVDRVDRAVMDGSDTAGRGITAKLWSIWPTSWSAEWFKPKSRRADLVKSGALVLAEIERIDRTTAPTATTAKGDA